MVAVSTVRPSYHRWSFFTSKTGGGASLFNASALVAQGVIRVKASRSHWALLIESQGTPIIYVSFNYRLGPLGFPAGHEADSKGALNLGLKDQLSALKWIQLNIAAFGGDESKVGNHIFQELFGIEYFIQVTVFGESAGAISIGVLFLNSGLENLARAAVSSNEP